MATATAPRIAPLVEQLLALTAIAAGIALALNEDLRSSLFGDDSASPQDDWSRA